MKYLILVSAVCAVVFTLFTQANSGSKSTQHAAHLATEETERFVSDLADVCHKSWQSMNWTIGEAQRLASDNPAFSQGIHRICTARAELFVQGYELSPFISPESQEEVFPIVFIQTVDEIKSLMRQNIPKLRVI